MHAFWKLALLIFFLLPSLLCAQHTIYVNAGFRILGYPVQSNSNSYRFYQTIASKTQPGIKLEAGLILPLTKEKYYLELGLAYSINPVNYTRYQNSYTNPPPLTYYKSHIQFIGIDYLSETVARFSKRIGKKKNWEIVTGLRFSFFYFNGKTQKDYLQGYRRKDDGVGNLEYVLIEEGRSKFRNREYDLMFSAWSETGIRSWCFKDGKAGIELHSGISFSHFFTQEDKITSYLLGISYLRRWNRAKKK